MFVEQRKRNLARFGSPVLLVSLAAPVVAATHEHKGSATLVQHAVSATSARADIAAADEWVRSYYSGWVDHDNRGFPARWEEAVGEARAQAARVRNAADWQLVMRRLVGVARDGHLQVWRPSPPTRLRWAGVAVALQGSRYTLRSSEFPGIDRAELVACDGMPIARFAERRLDRYQIDWTNLSRRQRGVARLFVDRGDTLFRPIASCRLRLGERRWTWRLRFREYEAADVSRAADQAARRGSGTTAFTERVTSNGGYWISLPTLGDSGAAAAQRQRVLNDRRRLADANYIVFDVRGNGGGNTELGDELLKTALQRSDLPPIGPSADKKVWRASEGVLEVLQAARAKATDNPEAAAFLDRVIPTIRAGTARGQPTAPDPYNNVTAVGGSADVASLNAIMPSLFVLTDGDCFSSCIGFVNRVRALGGKQVGDPTDRNETYGENWFERALPSGVGVMGIPLAIDTIPVPLRGGGIPDLPWTGDMNDTAAIDSFAAATIRR